MVLGNIDTVIIIDYSIIYLHPSIMVERCRDILVPSVVVEHGLFDFGMNFLYCRHGHCPEVFGFEDGNFIVVLLSLFMICSSAQ